VTLEENSMKKYGSSDTPVTTTQGKVHEYLGMTLDFLEKGKVLFMMNRYVENMLSEVSDDFNGMSVTRAPANLFTDNPLAEKLSHKKANIFHCLTATNGSCLFDFSSHATRYGQLEKIELMHLISLQRPGTHLAF
jgi:hypothetical protein